MNLTFKAAEGEPPYSINASALNDELAAALGGWGNGWSARHNAVEAIVDLDDARRADEALVRTVVEAHIANTDKREHNRTVIEQIAALEAKVTSRMVREAVLGSTPRLQAVETKIAALRATLQ